MKKLSLALALLLALTLSLSACGGPSNNNPDPGQAPEPPLNSEPEQGEPDPAPDSGVAPGTVFDSVSGFNKEAGQEGVWQYFFSGDNGETYDPCDSFDDYGTVRGWHPWEGSYLGVGINDDVEGFLELDTDGHSTAFSHQMGVLAFEAPADGKYVLTAAVWNPWDQACEAFTFRHSDGTVLYEQDMTELVKVHGYITPTDVELKTGDKIYIYCNAVGSDWVSAYVNATIYYEPTDDSCYEVPEVPVPPEEEVFVPTSEAAYNAFNQFDATACDGSNVPWVYAVTTDGVEFALAERYEDKDYGAHQWFSGSGTGAGPTDYTGEGWLELNTTAQDGEMTAVGFKAPADGTYTLHGYTHNPYGQPADMVHAVLNGAEISAIAIGEEPAEFSFAAELKAGETVYFYCNSTADWVSASLAVYADAQ